MATISSTTQSPTGHTVSASWRRLSRLALALVLLVGALARPAGAENSDTRVLPQLQHEAAANPSKAFRVVVQRIGVTTTADTKVKANGGIKIKELKANAFVATIPGGKLAALGNDPSIKYISPDAPMIKLGSVDGSKVGTLVACAINAWTCNATTGLPTTAGLWNGSGVSSNALTGLGVGVAVIDTGITPGPDFNLSASGNSRIAAKVIFNAELERTNDGHGHGTHVAGIIAGNSWHRSDTTLKGKYVGVAPEAKLINVRVANEQGLSYTSDVVNAIDWVITNRTTHNIRVMNLSLVSSVAESASTSVLAAAAERAWFNGIFVVVAAGNSGASTMLYPPANDPFVVTVGAADSVGTATRTDDGMAPWSSYGITQDGYNKPELVAPGRNIVSVLASGTSTLAVQHPDRRVDTNYLRLSGTSMAAPVVAGIAALAFQAHPEWTNDQLKWLLTQTATKATLAGLALPGQGAGQVDAKAVVTYNGTLGHANQGLAINLNLMTADGSVNYSSANWSSANWSSANWSSANWSSANWSSANWSSANWSSANWASATEGAVD